MQQPYQQQGMAFAPSQIQQQQIILHDQEEKIQQIGMKEEQIDGKPEVYKSKSYIKKKQK